MENDCLVRDNSKMRKWGKDMIEQMRSMEATLENNNGAPPKVEVLRPVRRPPKIKMMMVVAVLPSWVRSTMWVPRLRVSANGVGEMPLNGRMACIMILVSVVV